VCRFVRERKNPLLGGGKSTFTNTILNKMVEYPPDNRFYIVETALPVGETPLFPPVTNSD
jgi:Flp pilus assembly CpaF family ATPase